MPDADTPADPLPDERVRELLTLCEAGTISHFPACTGEVLCREVLRLREENDAMEWTLSDEEAGHEDTLRLWNESKADRDRLAAENVTLRKACEAIVEMLGKDCSSYRAGELAIAALKPTEPTA